MNRRKRLSVMIVALAFAAETGQTRASPITWEFAGEITRVSDPNDFFGGAVIVGSPFSGSYTFESTTPDSDPDDARFGLYDNAITSISGEVGNLTFLGPFRSTNFPPGSTNFIWISNDPALDDYLVRSGINLLGETVDLEMLLVDGTGAMFRSDSLPLLPPDLGSLDTAGFSIFFESEASGFSIAAPLTSLVPEPGTLALIGLGALVLLKRRRTPPNESMDQ